MKKNFIDNGVRLQKDPTQIFEGVIYEDDDFDFTICNPPFFNSQEERTIRRSSVIIMTEDLY